MFNMMQYSKFSSSPLSLIYCVKKHFVDVLMQVPHHKPATAQLYQQWCLSVIIFVEQGTVLEALHMS